MSLVKFRIASIIFLLITLYGCYGKPPTGFGSQLLQKIEAEKAATGVYPNFVEGNLANKVQKDIGVNDFYYIVDSARTSFTLKVFNENGLSDNYDSETKSWIRTDK